MPLQTSPQRITNEKPDLNLVSAIDWGENATLATMSHRNDGNVFLRKKGMGVIPLRHERLSDFTSGTKKMSNTFGNVFTLTTFGESHGKAVGGIVDGMPAGIKIDTAFIQQELNRRKPGQSKITTSRNEEDQAELLSGVFEGKTTGAPIGFVVYNKGQRPKDYDNMRHLFRPSHADYTYYEKYGLRDYRGGGRASARVTISRVVAGALAKMALRQIGISIQAYTTQVGHIKLEKDYHLYDLKQTETNAVRCPDAEKAQLMENLILHVKEAGDTIGGVIACIIKGTPIGLGEPEFGKLHAQLGAAMLGINAVKGFEYGEGFDGVEALGSEQNDAFTIQDGKIETATNHSGGVQGGISNGQDIFFRVAFKPVATILQEQDTVDTDGNATTLIAQGRHDPCVLPRAVPIVEAMAAMVMIDYYLLNKTTRI